VKLPVGRQEFKFQFPFTRWLNQLRVGFRLQTSQQQAIAPPILNLNCGSEGERKTLRRLHWNPAEGLTSESRWSGASTKELSACAWKSLILLFSQLGAIRVRIRGSTRRVDLPPAQVPAV
jgi:hypothetical protein